MSYVDVFDEELRPIARTGPIKHFHPNGMLKRMGTYVYGRPVGPAYTFHPNGIRDVQCTYSTDIHRHIGFYARHRPTGQLSAYVFFDTSGRLHGDVYVGGEHSTWHHGAPHRFLDTRDEHIHRFWLRIGTHHVILRFFRTRTSNTMNMTLYVQRMDTDDVNIQPPFIIYPCRLIIRRFDIIHIHAQYENFRHHRIYHNHMPPIPIKKLLHWSDVQLPSGPSIYIPIVQSIYDTIEDESSVDSIVGGLLRVLAPYGAYFPDGDDPLHTLLRAVGAQEKIDGAPDVL